MAQWHRLRWVHANLRYTMSEKKFAAALTKLATFNPEVISLNEVGSRRSVMRTWASTHGYHIWHPTGRGMTDDQALFFRKSRFTVISHGVKKMHGEPPGKPTARYLAWALVYDHISQSHILAEAFHSLAAVERHGKLNNIQRTKYYVTGNVNVIRFNRAKRKSLSKEHRLGPSILAGDLNWDWTPRSWINRTMGLYFKCNQVVLGKIKTLGSRGVDVVLKRGANVRYKDQHSGTDGSDHRYLLVDMEIR